MLRPPASRCAAADSRPHPKPIHRVGEQLAQTVLVGQVQRHHHALYFGPTQTLLPASVGVEAGAWAAGILRPRQFQHLSGTGIASIGSWGFGSLGKTAKKGQRSKSGTLTVMFAVPSATPVSIRPDRSAPMVTVAMGSDTATASASRRATCSGGCTRYWLLRLQRNWWRRWSSG